MSSQKDESFSLASASAAEKLIQITSKKSDDVKKTCRFLHQSCPIHSSADPPILQNILSTCDCVIFEDMDTVDLKLSLVLLKRYFNDLKIVYPQNNKLSVRISKSNPSYLIIGEDKDRIAVITKNLIRQTLSDKDSKDSKETTNMKIYVLSRTNQYNTQVLFDDQVLIHQIPSHQLPISFFLQSTVNPIFNHQSDMIIHLFACLLKSNMPKPSSYLKFVNKIELDFFQNEFLFSDPKKSFEYLFK